jgi:muconolactone delta-isomerase
LYKEKEVKWMMFLVIQRMKPGLALTPEMIDPYLASFEYYKDLEKKGIIKSLWAFVDGSGGGGIADVPSADQIYQILAGSPVSGLVDFEVYPLTTIDVVVETMRKAKEAAAKMGK